MGKNSVNVCEEIKKEKKGIVRKSKEKFWIFGIERKKERRKKEGGKMMKK